MSDTIFNKPDYFNDAPEHLKKQYENMVIKQLKKEIRNGLDIKIISVNKYNAYIERRYGKEIREISFEGLK